MGCVAGVFEKVPIIVEIAFEPMIMSTIGYSGQKSPIGDIWGSRRSATRH